MNIFFSHEITWKKNYDFEKKYEQIPSEFLIFMFYSMEWQISASLELNANFNIQWCWFAKEKCNNNPNNLNLDNKK